MNIQKTNIKSIHHATVVFSQLARRVFISSMLKSSDMLTFLVFRSVWSNFKQASLFSACVKTGSCLLLFLCISYFHWNNMSLLVANISICETLEVLHGWRNVAKTSINCWRANVENFVLVYMFPLNTVLYLCVSWEECIFWFLIKPKDCVTRKRSN